MVDTFVRGSEFRLQATILRAQTQPNISRVDPLSEHAFLPSGTTRLALLLGDPVSHSLSPALMTAAMRAAGLDMIYVAVRVDAAHIGAAVHGMHAMNVVGANVTIPHKQAVIPYLDHLTAAARAIGAVNTIYFGDDGRLSGDNTDAAGFTAPISGLRPAAALVLGTGGAARAAAWALGHELGVARVAVSGRRHDRARTLASEINVQCPTGVRVEALPWEERALCAGEVDLVVNATSLGMHPYEDETPLPDVSHLSERQLVYDLVYKPHPTRLLREAAGRGARTLGGIDMLIGQAAASFRRWTGRDMDTSAARRALMLARSH